jgi:predicted GNAT family acetyltransferase
MYNMKKSQLRHLIREEIKKAYSVNENVPDDGNVYGWYWPIADQAMEMIKTDSKYSGASLGAVGSGDGVTYITITVDLPSGSEEHFVVNFDENRQATDIESTFISEELEGEGTYRVYMNSDPDEPERINYEIYFGDGTKAEMIKQAKEMAYSNDPTNQYGDPILVKVVHEDDIDDVAFTNESVNEANSDWPLENKKWEKLWNDALTAPNTNTERKLMRWIVTNAKKYGLDPDRVDKLIGDWDGWAWKRHNGGFEDWMDDKLKESANEGFTKDDWDLKWKLPKDNLFNASKTIDAVNNRSNAIQDLLKLNSKELQSFDNDDEHPATNMSYNELMRWYYQVMKESVNEGLPPGYAKFLVSLQTLIGDIAPNAWGNKSQITSSSVKRVHNSLKKRYGDDYAKFNDLLKTQKGQFGNWYLNEPVNEEINTDIVNRNINLLDKAADMAIKNPKGNVVELAKIIKKYISGIRNSIKESVNEGELKVGDTFKMEWFELNGDKDIIVTAKVIRFNRKTITLQIVGKGYSTRLTPEEIQNRKVLDESVNEAEFKHINPSENKIKDAIKDVEKKFRLKANRDNPPQYAQLSLNKIMLSKVLGREELGKEHQGAWEKLKKEYNLRDAVNEADQYVDARGNFKLRNGLEVKIKSASEIQKLNMNEDYMKYNLQIAGKTVKIEKAFRGEFGGAPSEFTVKGYKAFETRSTGKPRKGFTQSIIGDVVRDEVSEGPGQKHYTKDGKEWKGKTHKMPDGTLMTQNPHNKDSEELSHK